MKKTVGATVLNAALLIPAAAQALSARTVPHRPPKVPAWKLTPTPHRPLFAAIPRKPNLPLLPFFKVPGATWDYEVEYDQPGPMIFWKDETLRKAASEWYPIGSYINLTMAPHSHFRALNVGQTPRTGDEAYRCMWIRPVVWGTIRRPTRTYWVHHPSGNTWFEFRTGARDEVAVHDPEDRRGRASYQDRFNEDSKRAKVTLRCAPVGKQERLIRVGRLTVAQPLYVTPPSLIEPPIGTFS